MFDISDKSLCCGCYACYSACPRKCISMQTDAEGFRYPFVDFDKCVKCGLCIQSCPILLKAVPDHQITAEAYACINKEDQLRMQSSSGGVFTLLAERVICNNGIVFGAGFDADWNVIHSSAVTSAELSNLRGSKYVQSSIGDTYQQVLDALRQGRQTLFSGTPCQVAGLRSYLRKEYANLICVDFICHGVPSPMVFKAYCADLERRYNAKIQRVLFRCKTSGWKKYSVAIRFDNHTEYSELYSNDVFMQGFLKNLYLRPSCYQCQFKTLNRNSDITLADFWGIDQILPCFDDDKGTSLIIINSLKGGEVFLSLTEKMNCEQVNLTQAIVHNPSAVKSARYHLGRKEFFRGLTEERNIIKLIVKYRRISVARKIYLKLKQMCFLSLPHS